MKRKLVLISFYFAPLGRADGVNRSYLARYLGDLGWDVDVVCAENPRGLLRNYQKDPSLLKVLGDRVTRRPVPYQFHAGIPDLLHMAHLRPDPFTHWVKRAVRNAVEIADGIVYAVVPPVSNAAVAVKVARQRKLPLVLDFRDNVFNLPKDWVRSAQAVLASTDWSLREMRTYYGISDATAGLTYFNGSPDTPSGMHLPAARRSGVIYAGLMNWEQHPFMVARLLDAARKQAPGLANQLHADFFGPRNYYTRLMWHGHVRQVGRLNGYLPFADMRRRFQEAQFGLATLVSPTKLYCIPSKVFQYIAAGLPIIASSPAGALADFVRSHGIGLHAQPADITDIAPILVNLLANPPEMDALRARVEAVRNRFTLRSQVASVSTLLEQFLV